MSGELIRIDGGFARMLRSKVAMSMSDNRRRSTTTTTQEFGGSFGE
jgi:hypothetical protein